MFVVLWWTNSDMVVGAENGLYDSYSLYRRWAIQHILPNIYGDLHRVTGQ